MRIVDDVRDDVIGVWRVGWSGRIMGYVLAAGPACGALSTWLGALSHLNAQSAGSAGIATAVALGFGLFAWWGLLRVRLELTTDMIAMVNPWGTQRLPWSRVSAVSLGNWGAQFHTTDGFTYTAYALSDLAGGTRQDARFADVRRIVDAQLRSGQPL
ncbi:PH domain-containing protein [Streptomyces sp. NPDC058676]|uniref:PH domain-containing protein n=1 Tax=unclassified Streptomyces TaxID=2593676 RepID=UPI003654DFE5